MKYIKSDEDYAAIVKLCELGVGRDIVGFPNSPTNVVQIVEETIETLKIRVRENRVEFGEMEENAKTIRELINIAETFWDHMEFGTPEDEILYKKLLNIKNEAL
jgi:hypothetical protein